MYLSEPYKTSVIQSTLQKPHLVAEEQLPVPASTSAQHTGYEEEAAAAAVGGRAASYMKPWQEGGGGAPPTYLLAYCQ